MKLLYLPAYYEPEKYSGRYLNENIIEDFLKEDEKNEITVYTPIPTRGVSKQERNIYKKRKKEQLYNGRLTINRYRLFREKTSTIQRMIRYILQGIKQILYTFYLKNIDVIMMGSTPPTNGIVGTIIKKIHKWPFIYNLQDIFPETLVSTNITSQKSFMYRLGEKIENITYKNADSIHVPSEDFKSNLIKKQVPEEKIKVIHNWVDEEKVKPIETEKNSIFQQFDIDKHKFNVLYAGNIGKAQNIELLVKVAIQMQEYKEIEFIIFGDGTEKKTIEEMVEKEKLENLKIFPLQTYEKVSEVYSMANVSIVICKRGFGGVSIPSKTWTIMATGTPIIASFDRETELQKIIEENKIGIFATSDNETELKDAIIKLYQNQDLLAEYGNNARKYIEMHLTRAQATKQYIESIKQAYKKGR